MLNHTTPERASPMRTFFIVTAVVLLVGGAYVGWTFSSRWEANQAIVERAVEKKRAQDQETFEAMGGNHFEILEFSADPVTIQAGEKSSLCYSVSNTKAVKIDPLPEEPTWPAFARCVHVSPRKTAKYTLTIDDGAGHTKTASVEVKVQ